MCIDCEKYFSKKLSKDDVEELKKVPYISVELKIERMKTLERKWYLCYCKKCGDTRLIFE